jgi:gluconolactonase
MNKLVYFSLLIALFTYSCGYKTNPNKTGASIEILDPAALSLINPEAKQLILAEGFDWTEGPLWVEDLNALLFTDIPKNSIFKVTKNGELNLYLNPSGYTGEKARGGEVGANGLILNSEGFLVLCQHGDRRMARMKSSVDNPKPEFTTLVDSYQGMRLNSPNDGVYDQLGNLYFTDPPYGLEFNINDPSKELNF